jgi:hypothetical protein
VGHERIGFLPRTRQWQAIVHELAKYSGDSQSVKLIADSTLECLRTIYKTFAFDESMINAIKLFTTLCFSASTNNQAEYLNKHGFTTDENLSLLSLMQSVNSCILTDSDSPEINKIARDAAMQALIAYKQKHETEQLHFVEFEPDNVWRGINNGAAFCEMARNFISAFTDRQLRYYLERVAAGTINDFSNLVSFSKGLAAQANDISRHTSEISKLMQSFAAGWYNKYSAKRLPPNNEISRFLSVTFGKLREEFRKEALES